MQLPPRKKGVSIYDKHWKQLKANPDKLITFTLEKHQQERFIRMVQKRKWLDRAYKKLNPTAKIKVYRYENSVKLILQLKPHLSSILNH